MGFSKGAVASIFSSNTRFKEMYGSSAKFASLTEFADTQHGYDSPLSPRKLAVPSAQSTRQCQFIEKNRGEIFNMQSGAPFSYSDPCVQIGAHVGHNPDSTEQTVKSVVTFLQAL